MKVIIIEDIRGFGKKYDVKEVKSGYARNFLFPRNLAKAATEIGLKELEKQKAEWGKKEEGIKEKLKEAARKLESEKIVFELKAGEKNEVFGSVTKDDILKKISIKDAEVKLAKPIKSLGEHEVEVDLSKGIKAKIKVLVNPAK
jgi:large subunit ribosomal protein L9